MENRSTIGVEVSTASCKPMNSMPSAPKFSERLGQMRHRASEAVEAKRDGVFRSGQ
jgi:hypothetical protein